MFLLPPHVAVYVWLVLGMTLDPMVPVLAPLLGVPLQPGMDQPYFSRSIMEFWGRRSVLVLEPQVSYHSCFFHIYPGCLVLKHDHAPRWNQIVSCTLRDCVYLPIMELDVREITEVGSSAKKDEIDARRGQSRSTIAWKRATALSVSFLVSGIMHEVMNM